MRLPFFSRSSSMVLVADAGISGCGVGIVEVGDDAHARIVAAARSFAPLEKRNGSSAIANITETFAESAASAQAQLAKAGRSGAPSAAYIVIHAPWTVSRTLSIEKSFDTDTPISADLIGSLANKVLQDATDVRSDELLEASVTHVELNGYPVKEPSHHMAQHIKVSVLVSTMEKKYREAIETAAHRAFPGVQVKLRSHVRALVSTLHESDGTRNGIIIDLGEEGTAISTVRKDVLDSQEIIPVGMHALLSHVAGTGSREETLSLLSMLEKGTCSTSACDQIMQALASAEPQITKSFGEGLAALAAKRRLPNDAILIAHPDIAAWFARFLARIDFAQFTSTSQPLSVRILTLSDLSPMVTLAPGVMSDMPLTLAAVLVHTEMTHRARP